MGARVTQDEALFDEAKKCLAAENATRRAAPGAAPRAVARRI